MTVFLQLLFAVSTWIAAERADRSPWDVYATVHAAVAIAPQYDHDPALLLAVAAVESRWDRTSGCATERSMCGAYRQIAHISGMWADECWKGNTLVCRQPGGTPLSAAELTNIYTATRVAARHLYYLRERYGEDEYLAAYNRGGRNRHDEAGARYTASVMRAYRRLNTL